MRLPTENILVGLVRDVVKKKEDLCREAIVHQLGHDIAVSEIAKRCDFGVWADKTEIFRVDGVAKIVFYPLEMETECTGTGFSYTAVQKYEKLY